jgi:hypothetical protein
MTNYLKHFPQPLLEDVVENRCVPFIGAGFSRNALLPAGATMPLWDGLAKSLAAQIPDFEYSDSLDAISAFDHAYSRAKLVEALGRLLHIATAQPGNSHKAFCALPFETVCTTNFDFLLERGYESVGKYCRPITDEDQLSTHTGNATVDLLKFHGDLNHPRRMVVTEEDYAAFIARNPLIATFLANQLISKTALFVGYSLDDPDFRLIWQIVGDRLGKLRRLAYTIKVGADAREIARFERRGVRVINIPGKASQYPDVFEALFKELKDRWDAFTAEKTARIEESPLTELALPPDARSRICSIIAPRSTLGFYRSAVFPLVERWGFTPVVAEDLVASGESFPAKLSALISRSELVILDVSTRATMMEAGLVLAQRRGEDGVLAIMAPDADVPLEWLTRMSLLRPEKLEDDEAAEAFLRRIDDWLRNASERLQPQLQEEPVRLLRKKEHRAALISAVALLETRLRMRLAKPSQDLAPSHVPLSQLLRIAARSGVINDADAASLRRAASMRNDALHSGAHFSPTEATRAVNVIMAFLSGFEGHSF